MKKVDVYTDGACLGNPGPGGWAFIIKYENGKENSFRALIDSETGKIICAVKTARLPLPKSKTKVTMPGHFPPTRITLVMPMFPLPCLRMLIFSQ